MVKWLLVVVLVIETALRGDSGGRYKACRCLSTRLKYE
jgi:hypothetical protein